MIINDKRYKLLLLTTNRDFILDVIKQEKINTLEELLAYLDREIGKVKND